MTTNQNHVRPRWMAVIAALSLTAISFVSVAPTAVAHECTAEKGESAESDCSKPCKEGEDHSHSVTHHHENGFENDENHIHYACSSKASDPEEPEDECMTPRILGMCIVDDGSSLPQVTG